MPDAAAEVLTAEGAASYLGVSLTTLYRLAKAGKIPFYRFGQRYHFRRATLDALIARQEEAGAWQV